jgi:glycosyltransferase involved in cell wall biosynthesis
MKICLVTAFPPSGRQLNEYALHIATELQRNTQINLSVLGDKLGDYAFATDEHGKPVTQSDASELPEFHVVRCWDFNDPFNFLRIARAVRRLKPDVVWFNLVFSTFATQDHPIAAFSGLCAPALTRLMGFYTHVTLHHILEHVDFAGAGVKQEKLFRFSSEIATRTLLRANSVSVLLSGYQKTLSKKYAAENVLLGTHGIFTSRPTLPDFEKRAASGLRILAIGHWGTYKRLETLMEAFPEISRRHPGVKLVIAGANHHNRPGYWESVQEQHRDNPDIEFKGYVAEEAIPELFGSSSIVVLPYDSATGSSGPAHQACEYGVPVVSADLPDFRMMAADEDMAISFYKTGDAADLADKISAILDSPEEQRRMGEQNFHAAVRMTMPRVVRHYLRWFALEKRMRSMNIGDDKATQRWRRMHKRSIRFRQRLNLSGWMAKRDESRASAALATADLLNEE